MLFAVIPLLVAGVASAAPEYPVEHPVERPVETQFTVSYESARNTATLSTSTAEEPDAGTFGVEGATNDVSVSVVGPNGLVNHGQIVRQVHELADVRQLGCITRTVAQSDVGKGDHQIRPLEQSTSSDATESVDPSVLDVECLDSNGPSEPVPAGASEHRSDDQDRPQGKGDDQDRPQGKVADAPGKDK
jgi:hypothetical protein